MILFQSQFGKRLRTRVRVYVWKSENCLLVLFRFLPSWESDGGTVLRTNPLSNTQIASRILVAGMVKPMRRSSFMLWVQFCYCDLKFFRENISIGTNDLITVSCFLMSFYIWWLETNNFSNCNVIWHSICENENLAKIEYSIKNGYR